MKRVLRSAILGVAVAATTLSVIPAAQADDHGRRHYRHHHHPGHSGGDALAAGIAGLAVGAIVGGVLSQPTHARPVYVAPRTYYRPAPVYRYSLEPWSPEWYRACSIRYRSFDPRSGTYLGYDGYRHFCQVG